MVKRKKRKKNPAATHPSGVSESCVTRYGNEGSEDLQPPCVDTQNYALNVGVPGG